MRGERTGAENESRGDAARNFGYPLRLRVAASPRRCSSRIPNKAMARHWDPLRDLVTLQDRMNRLFQDAAEKRSHGEEEGEQEIERADWFPAADIYETEQDFTISVDLPGIERTALEINVDDDKLVIRGERAAEEAAGQRRTERPHGRFLRRFGVPASVDQKGISAEYKDGVLRVLLPKRKEPKARRVEIKVS